MQVEMNRMDKASVTARYGVLPRYGVPPLTERPRYVLVLLALIVFTFCLSRVRRFAVHNTLTCIADYSASSA